jgi:hypothetical protein
MRRIFNHIVLAVGLASATEVFEMSSLGAGPIATDYFIKGQNAISALQDFNFELEFNIFTTGGASTTIQSMKKLRTQVESFAASGCAACYTELFDSDGLNLEL